jgi:hypothetical protein
MGTEEALWPSRPGTGHQHPSLAMERLDSAGRRSERPRVTPGRHGRSGSPHQYEVRYGVDPRYWPVRCSSVLYQYWYTWMKHAYSVLRTSVQYTTPSGRRRVFFPRDGWFRTVHGRGADDWMTTQLVGWTVDVGTEYIFGLSLRPISDAQSCNDASRNRNINGNVEDPVQYSAYATHSVCQGLGRRLRMYVILYWYSVQYGTCTCWTVRSTEYGVQQVRSTRSRHAQVLRTGKYW